jgi:Flp pilus assembly pilin Flp
LQSILEFFNRLAIRTKEEAGQTLVEYALIIALISLLVIGLALLVAPGLTDIFTSVGDTLETAAS